MKHKSKRIRLLSDYPEDLEYVSMRPDLKKFYYSVLETALIYVTAIVIECIKNDIPVDMSYLLTELDSCVDIMTDEYDDGIDYTIDQNDTDFVLAGLGNFIQLYINTLYAANPPIGDVDEWFTADAVDVSLFPDNIEICIKVVPRYDHGLRRT